MYDSRDVAAYIAQECRRGDIEYNNTKIQKLLYCAYGVMLAWRDERLCDEYPRAWPYGPVFPKVFKYIYHGGDISTYSNLVANSAPDYFLTAIKMVLDFFGQFTAKSLSAWTHKPDSPWWRVIKVEHAQMNSFMPDEYIKDYFAENVLAQQP